MQKKKYLFKLKYTDIFCRPVGCVDFCIVERPVTIQILQYSHEYDTTGNQTNVFHIITVIYQPIHFYRNISMENILANIAARLVIWVVCRLTEIRSLQPAVGG